MAQHNESIVRHRTLGKDWTFLPTAVVWAISFSKLAQDILGDTLGTFLGVHLTAAHISPGLTALIQDVVQLTQNNMDILDQ